MHATHKTLVASAAHLIPALSPSLAGGVPRNLTTKAWPLWQFAHLFAVAGHISLPMRESWCNSRGDLDVQWRQPAHPCAGCVM